MEELVSKVADIFWIEVQRVAKMIKPALLGRLRIPLRDAGCK